MAENLFPVFDVPSIEVNETQSQEYKKSIYWDYELGDFVRDKSHKNIASTRKEAYIQWCIKMVATERFTCLAYDTDRGTEMNNALSNGDREAAESAIERTITEALMINPRTEYIREFEFEWSGDELKISFVVKGKEYDEEKVTTSVSM